MAKKKTSIVQEVTQEIKLEEVKQEEVKPEEVTQEAPKAKTKATKKDDGLVEFEHFVKEGTMRILDRTYEVKDFKVRILPEHEKYAVHHGLKRRN